MERRIAVVQHGDYREALRLQAAGAAEPYFGMYYTLGVLRDLLADSPHLVVSLNPNPAEPYCEDAGRARLVGLPLPKRLPVPGGGLLSEIVWGGRVLDCLREFRPTHLLLRAYGPVAWRTMRWSTRHNVPAVGVFAGAFDGPTAFHRWAARRTAQLLNHDSVLLVGNHRRPATRSMVELGLRSDKAFAYDWPGARRPRDHAPKTLGAGRPLRLAYVGKVIRAKGVGEAIAATAMLRRAGTPATLEVVGDGADLPEMRALAGGAGDGAVSFAGRIGNDEAFERMRQADLVCVPSRHEFPEGLPLTLTEALASRTPVVASDHPMHTEAFREGEGVTFFPAGDAAALAGRIRAASDPATYRRLSLTTADAFARIECPTTFGDLIDRWKRTF